MRPISNRYVTRWRVGRMSAEKSAPAQPTERSDRVEREEMGITHGDFFRIFPRLMAPAEVIREGLQVTVTWEADRRSLQVALSEEKKRKIAQLRIPYVELEFRFRNFSSHERQAFLARFHRAFQKGGG